MWLRLCLHSLSRHWLCAKCSSEQVCLPGDFFPSCVAFSFVFYNFRRNIFLTAIHKKMKWGDGGCRVHYLFGGASSVRSWQLCLHETDSHRGSQCTTDKSGWASYMDRMRKWGMCRKGSKWKGFHAEVHGLTAEEWSMQVLKFIKWVGERGRVFRMWYLSQLNGEFWYVLRKEQKYCVFILSTQHSSDWRLMSRLSINVLE